MSGKWPGGGEEEMRSRGRESGGGGGGGDDGRRGEGASVGQIDQLPVSNQSREEGTEEKVGGRQRKVCFAPVWSAVNGTGGILLGGSDQAGGSSRPPSWF